MTLILTISKIKERHDTMMLNTIKNMKALCAEYEINVKFNDECTYMDCSSMHILNVFLRFNTQRVGHTLDRRERSISPNTPDG